MMIEMWCGKTTWENVDVAELTKNYLANSIAMDCKSNLRAITMVHYKAILQVYIIEA